MQGWLEAFAAHPRIGDVDNLRQRFGSFADHSRSEQGASGATEQQIQVCQLSLSLVLSGY